jgi:lipopolysaccharide/colanic/teichoic acid biosynthesis glycosyltransferase
MDDREHSAAAFGPEGRKGAHSQPRAVSIVHERGTYERALKPVIDRFAGFTLSLVTFPFVMVIVPVIWAKLGRPAIFKQVRVGRFGQEFTVYKLRTMQTDRRAGDVSISHTDRRVNHKSSFDPRHTSLGRFLRKWSFDEVPQFWNVAIGNMSLIGPRPELPKIVNRYEPWQHRRHEVKPGLTGLWQVSARGDAPMHEATNIDVAYVDNIGFTEDLRIVFATPKAALGSRMGH